MKYIKKLEAYINNNEIYFVICQYKDPIPNRVKKNKDAQKNINEFLAKNIGILNSTVNNPSILPQTRGYYVTYKQKIPYDLQTYGFFEYVFENDAQAAFRSDEIIYHSKNIEDVKAQIESNKYNI